MHDAMKQRVHDTFSEIHEALNLKQQEFIAKLQTLNDHHINKLAALRSDCQKGIDTMKNVESQCKDKWTQNVNRMTLNDDKKDDEQSASELISRCLRTLTGILMMTCYLKLVLTVSYPSNSTFRVRHRYCTGD